MPVGSTQRLQTLIRVRCTGSDEYVRETLEECRFVPLVGEAGWSAPEMTGVMQAAPSASSPEITARPIGETSEPIADIDTVEIDPRRDRFSGARTR